MNVELAARRYAEFFADLTPDTTSELRELAVEQLHFKDPFNDLHGVERVIAMLDHMFETTVDPKFVINRIAVSGDVAFISWDFTCRTSGRKQISVALTGASELSFDCEKLLVEHIDHWDAASQLYARIPLVGGFFRWLAKRFAADA